MAFPFKKIFGFGQPQSNNDMQVENHVAIPIEELSGDAKKVKKYVTNAKDHNITEEKGECRYCQEEELASKLEAPCNCNGTLKYAHRICVVRWCNIKRNTICEICKQPYSPNYSVTGPPPPPPNDVDDEIPMSEQWRIPGTNIRLFTPVQQTRRGMNRLLRSMNTDFTLRNPSGGVLFGTLLVIILAVAVIRDAYYYTPSKEDKFFHMLYIAVVIFAAPTYVLTWIWEYRAQRERRQSEMERERDLTMEDIVQI